MALPGEDTYVMGSTFVFSLAGIPGNKLVVVCSVYKRLGKKKKDS